MNKKHLDFFKVILNRQIDELMRHADHVISEMSSQRIQESESIDKASAENDQSLKLKIRSRESLLIQKIQQALERIKIGSYGTCESCGEDISIQRLKARPVTAKCLFCKEEEERIEKLNEA
ncbi:RNA polymerase-binding protein DksA [uncultured Desulfobacter sp.]|uniref:RNA polymerase-binding protein DksA n=1 Tax=uncultured Desulfobacter sp. TaxID=240139 RepID=UPI0029F59CF2|nr:RNA polymerase-binding protein DksA [uncultured Desulfobacter sp.]